MAEPTPSSEQSMRSYRLDRVKRELTARNIAAVVLFDPINVRYATGSRNMQVWTMHNACRYAFIAANGPVILFDYSRTGHLSRHLETLTEIRPAVSWDYFAAGERCMEQAERWAAEIADLLTTNAGRGSRLAIDRGDTLPLAALARLGVAVEDAKPLMEKARSIKSPDEISAMRRAIRVCESCVSKMRTSLRPGVREIDLLAVFEHESLSLGGEYLETRLVASGPRTNPWYQEATDRVVESGEIVTFDTDMIGPGGLFADISRAWIVGDRKPTAKQQNLYELAREQIEHNSQLVRPGLSFRDFARAAWQIPEPYVPNRYAEILHGAGLGVEYPTIYHAQDWGGSGYDGVFEEDMIVCIESFIGAAGGREGVKLEQQVLITNSGIEQLSTYPLEIGS